MCCSKDSTALLAALHTEPLRKKHSWSLRTKLSLAEQRWGATWTRGVLERNCWELLLTGLLAVQVKLGCFSPASQEMLRQNTLGNDGSFRQGSIHVLHCVHCPPLACQADFADAILCEPEAPRDFGFFSLSV